MRRPVSTARRTPERPVSVSTTLAAALATSVAPALQGGDQAELVFGEDAGEGVAAVGGGGAVLQVGGAADALADADLGGNRARGGGAVAGDHDYAHAQALQALHQRLRVGANGILQAEEADGFQAASLAGGDGENASAGGGEAGDGGGRSGGLASAEHGVRRAFHD